MKKLFAFLAAIIVISSAGCTCADGEDFDFADLGITTLQTVSNGVDVWSVLCVVKNIAVAVDECNTPPAAPPASSVVEYLYKPEVNNSGEFFVVDRTPFTTKTLQPDANSENRDQMDFPTPRRGTYKMVVRVDVNGVVPEGNESNNVREISKVVF